MTNLLPGDRSRSLPVSLRWRMVRPGFLLVTVSACLLGLASVVAAGHTINPALAVITVALASLAHAGANVLNDLHDARNGADAANTEGLFPFTGGSRLIQQGVVSEQDTARWAGTLMLLVIAAGGWLAARSGGGIFLTGAAGLALAWAYSAPPLQLMSRGLGELAVAAAWWLVVIGAAQVQTGLPPVTSVATGFGFGLLVGCILLVNGFPDARADAQAGKRTLVVRIGPAGAARLYIALSAAAYAALVLGVSGGWLPVRALYGLGALPLSLAAVAGLWRHRQQPERLRPTIVLTLLAANAYALMVATALVLATEV